MQVFWRARLGYLQETCRRLVTYRAVARVLLVRGRLVGAVLLEQDEHWQLEGRRMFSAESMAAIPSLEDLPALQAACSACACLWIN